MFERLKRLYADGRIGKENLDIAVANGWITKEQACMITATHVESEIEEQGE